MVKPATELEMQRRNTLAYIAADADTVTPMRAGRAPSGDGGWVNTDPAPTDNPVTLRVQPAGGRVNGPDERTTPDGRVVLPTHEIVAPWDADLQAGDTFTWNGKTLEVIWISDDHEYQTFGEALAGGR